MTSDPGSGPVEQAYEIRAGDGAVIFRPYRWSLGRTALRVLFYPMIVILLCAGVFALTGNPGSALTFAAFIPGVALPIFLVVAAIVIANRTTTIIADTSTVTKKFLWSSRVYPRSEIVAIEYLAPLRGALPCRFKRRDGRVAFHISVSPWRDLQGHLRDLAAFLRVPLTARTGRANFRL